MKLYCEIEEKNGIKTIKRGPCPLPQNTETISNFNAITDVNILKQHGWLPYSKITDNKKVIVSSNVVILDDVVQETFVTRDETTEESEALKWIEIRKQRDILLSETDILVLADRWEKLSTTQKQKLSTYRQSLRDLPQTYEFSYDVVWPIND
jgi:hypothetical protein